MSFTPGLVSVLIPTHQRRECLRRALRSLASQSVPGEEYEVVVCVDRSSDGTDELLAALRMPYRLLVTRSERPGRASACNAALARASGEVVILLDDDMQPAPQFVERHRAWHPPGSRVCVMGAVPVLLDRASPHAARYIAAKFAAHMARIALPEHVFVPRDFYSGNASLRTEVLRELEGYDESFGAYGNEDVELGVRLRAAGVELRFDEAALAHQEFGKSLRELCADTREKGATTVRLARTHPSVFGALRLAQPRDSSRPWLAARAILLAATRRSPGLPALVFWLAVVLERAGLWRAPLFYRAVLDYAFWAGVDSALDPRGEVGDLHLLHEQLRRGPIDLLLH